MPWDSRCPAGLDHFTEYYESTREAAAAVIFGTIMLFFWPSGPVVDPMATTSSNKKPEFFWPRQVLRKLLKLKSMNDKFKADEPDQDEEEDSADEYDFSDSSEEKKGLGTRLPPLHPNTPPDRTGHSLGGLARRQSETLWTQFVDMQDYRIHVGTWNVAGKSPSPDLDLKEWLEVNPATDIYVIGLQEVVPLNAGNVLGNTDESPPAKWDALIRKTLNASHRRAMSAPSSPGIIPGIITESSQVVEKSGSEQDDEEADDEYETEGVNLNPAGFSFNNNMTMTTKHIIKKGGHRRIHSAFEQTSSGLLSTSSKLPVLGQVNGSSYTMTPPSSPVPEQIPSPGSDNYVRIVSKQMVGVYISIWIRKNIRRYVHHLKVSCVGCGLMNYCGNKGSIAVSLMLHQTSFCFVCTHLTSGEKEGDELRRNADVTEIHRRTSFVRSPRVFNVDIPETILQHERVVWLGDLNYRVAMSDVETRALVAKEDWETLLEKDQLKLEQSAGRVFEGWQEGDIVFPPTYKYLKGSDRYFGENSRPGDKRRTPSWCDRILFRGRGLKQISYDRRECRFSDHRPVNAVFIAEVEAFSNRKIRNLARLTSSLPTRKSLGSCNEELENFLRSLKDDSANSPWNLSHRNGLKPKKMYTCEIRDEEATTSR